MKLPLRYDDYNHEWFDADGVKMGGLIHRLQSGYSNVDIDKLSYKMGAGPELYDELKKREWRIGTYVYADGRVVSGCPVCGKTEEQGHAPDCTLDAALRAAEGK